MIKNAKENKTLDNILTWHFIWSKYYFKKKNYGALIALIIFVPIMIRIIFRIFLYQITNKKELVEKYKYRLSGLITSIIGKKSALRP